MCGRGAAGSWLLSDIATPNPECSARFFHRCVRARRSRSTSNVGRLLATAKSTCNLPVLVRGSCRVASEDRKSCNHTRRRAGTREVGVFERFYHEVVSEYIWDRFGLAHCARVQLCRRKGPTSPDRADLECCGRFRAWSRPTGRPALPPRIPRGRVYQIRRPFPRQRRENVAHGHHAHLTPRVDR